MSPAQKTKQTPARALTIEFSGICTLVWDAKASVAEVRLVDLGAAGFQKHYAALAMVVDENFSSLSIKGPDAETAVSLPGADRDLGIWNLIGTDVEFVGASGKLTVDNSKVDPSKKPAKDASSIQWLANLSFLTESAELDPMCPIAATVRIPAGRITATTAAGARKVEFLDNGTPVAPARYCVSRFKAVIPFATELAIRLDRRRVFRVRESQSMVISNTCVCGLGLPGLPNHFYGHYDVTSAKRRPTVERAGPKPMYPEFPELCFGAVVIK